MIPAGAAGPDGAALTQIGTGPGLGPGPPELPRHRDRHRDQRSCAGTGTGASSSLPRYRPELFRYRALPLFRARALPLFRARALPLFRILGSGSSQRDPMTFPDG
ncbi:hypothetical protein DUI87_33781 [Hirundo rustica rustica]|uniref:Uncharacterized protein n=1 Tax=Hirundo rustica rustica TaxID=333673 RepID=A0A3M0J5C5_HIRRU|nr:hypothetical protein DUI87_33781 [Hirundo rustica rustica]